MVPMAGVEPARGVNHTRFWVWHVYQFHHIGLLKFQKGFPIEKYYQKHFKISIKIFTFLQLSLNTY